MADKPAVTIHYCTQCNWLLRSAWMAQELLHTFAGDLSAVTLQPGSGGVFEISIDGQVIWERKTGRRLSRCGSTEAAGARCLLAGSRTGARGQEKP